jgi:hypothetical protein
MAYGLNPMKNLGMGEVRKRNAVSIPILKKKGLIP